MGRWSRFLDSIDRPRFCADCGKPVKVEDLPSFDAMTGLELPQWVWHCPEVDLTVTSRRFVATQSGIVIHPWGQGRPRWHRAEHPELPG